jgi:hypothetical protein
MLPWYEQERIAAKTATVRLVRSYGKLKGVKPLLEWRNWQTHGTQKPEHRISGGKEPYPLYTLRSAMLCHDNAHLPQNHYKTTTVDVRTSCRSNGKLSGNLDR